MLQLFRSGLTSYFASTLLGLLIASFALWGIGGDILGGAGSNVAQIGDSKLTVQDYAREFQNKFADIQQQSDGQITREMAVDQGFARRWVADLVQRESFAYAAHDLNIRVTDDQLREFIVGIEAFQDTLGQFSKTKFDSLAGYRGYSASEFEEVLRRDLERQYLMTSIVSGVSVPDTVQKTFVKYLSEERTAEILTIPASSMQDIAEPDEDILKKYYNDNSSNYMAPEYRDVRFILLSTADFMKDVTVTPEELEKALAASAETPSDGETRDVQQVLFDSKEAADKAYADLEAGRAFADIITASGLGPDEATVAEHTPQDIGDVYGALAAESIFAAAEGAYTAPVETDFGWRIFNVVKITAAASGADDLRAETEKTLKQEKALDILYDKSELINDELAAGSSLEQIAKALNLELKTAKNIDRTGYDSKGDLVAGVPTNPAFLSTVFAAQVGDEPMLEELNESEYYLFMVDNVQETTLRPFAEVKSSVRELWMIDARRNKAREKANDILTKTNDGLSLEELAKTTPDASYNNVTTTRFDQTGQVARNIQNSIFELKPGHAQIMTAADGNGFVVVKVLSRSFPENGFPLAQQARLKEQLTQQYQQQLLANYWLYLESALPVKLNEQGINNVHNQLTTREQ